MLNKTKQNLRCDINCQGMATASVWRLSDIAEISVREEEKQCPLGNNGGAIKYCPCH